MGKIPLIMAILTSIIIAVVVYVLALFALGGLSRSDLNLLPKGEKFVKILERVHFIR